MIKVYPKMNNSNVNFGKTISPQETQEYIDAYKKAEQARNTISRDPSANALADNLSKMSGGSPKIKGTPEQYAIMQDKVDLLVGENGVKDNLVKASNKFKKDGNVPVDNVPKIIEKLFKKWSNSGIIKYLSKKGPKGIALALAAGNVGKELVGTTVYTIQALTNEDLPADKRKFIGMYDLVVGLISTTFSAVFGFGAIAVQDKLIQKALKKNVGKEFPKYAGAYAGLVWLIPQLLQTIIGKRIVAPAIATPLAGKMKANMIAKADAKKADTLPAAKPADDAKTVKLVPEVNDEPKETITVQYVSLSSYVDNANSSKNAA